MTLSEYQLKYGELSSAERQFFRRCRRLLELHTKPVPSHFGVRSLNGRKTRIRTNLLIEYGYLKEGNRWVKGPFALW